jgi:hypothetical protein
MKLVKYIDCFKVKGASPVAFILPADASIPDMDEAREIARLTDREFVSLASIVTSDDPWGESERLGVEMAVGIPGKMF